MNEPISEKILFAYFEKRATPHEKSLIKEWLQDKHNEEFFYQSLAKWESSHLQFVPDEDQAMQNFRRFLDSESDQSIPSMFKAAPARKHVVLPGRMLMGIAASVIFILCISLYALKDQFLYEIHSTSYGMTKNVLLPDGSEVTLNANSTLKVPKDLATDALREVWLDGEAFFSVAKRPGHVRFAVHTNNLDVEVLGTKFNVNNRRGKTEVVLSEGSVKLVSLDEETKPVIMKPGDFVSVSKKEPVFRKKTVEPENFVAWQTNKLIFEDTPLAIVAEKIEDYYGVDVEILNADIGRKQLTGTLPNNDLGIVLRSLTTSHNLKIERNGDRITIE